MFKETDFSVVMLYYPTYPDLLSRVDIVIRYIQVDFTFRLPDYVRYIEVLFHTFYIEYHSLKRVVYCTH